MSTNNQIYENLSSTHSSTSSKKHLNTGLNNNCINEKTNSLIMEQPVGTSSTSSSKKMSAATTNSVNSINNNSKPPLHVQEALPKGHKESLYATPLRKSDRHKNQTRSSASSRTAHLQDKMNNMNNLNSKNNNTEAGAAESATDSDMKNMMDRTYLNSELGENRIRDFLKDTAQMHKKIDLHNKEQINANFSYLARKEHFANLVHQNVLNDSQETNEAGASQVDEEDSEKDLINLDESNEGVDGSLEQSEKLINKLVSMQNIPAASTSAPVIGGFSSRLLSTPINVNLNREWVLKKIAMCLEQRASKKPPPSLPENGESFYPRAAIAHHQQSHNLPQLGYLVLGSNGSGKTTICNDIIHGTIGTKGILNRRLLAFYFVNSQNPDCHSMSIFIRSLVLQILSFSSLLGRRNGDESQEKIESLDKLDILAKEINNLKLDEGSTSLLVDKELEEMILSEIKLNERVADFCSKKSKIIRQKSDPTENAETGEPDKYTTHPPLHKHIEKLVPKEDVEEENKSEKSSPSRKISKIPVKIGMKLATPQKVADSPSESIKDGGGEGIADIDQTLQEDIAKEINDDKEKEIDDVLEEPKDESKLDKDQQEKVTEKSLVAKDVTDCAPPPIPMKIPQETTEDDDPKSEKPPPLPKLKDCRTLIADAYYEMLLSNPEIFEALIVDNIEKNPDDCLKKAILFPLLEIAPPKNALLVLVDSLDENYLNDGSLMSTLKGKNSAKSRNIAELLSNHIHLLPKWLFLVCTAKKQNKHITKLFTGFKKLTLDDLRKSHVVKDVQQYIINRLNVDFRGINLNKEVIESLNQLYIKSNGCLLYLYKVLTGIKEGFFTFREIKLIPCTLNGLYLYICQKSFNKKQYSKIRPVLNVLLVCHQPVDKAFVFNCLRTYNYSIDWEDFNSRIDLMRNILEVDDTSNTIRIFHNSFCEWLIDVKFSTKKFLCDLNEGHIMISMYYTLISETLCANKVREYLHHLIKAAEYLSHKNDQLDLLMILLESKTNLNDCFYTNFLNCCAHCEFEYKTDVNWSMRSRQMIEQLLGQQLNEDFTIFLSNFFKPNLPTNAKVLKLLIETGINNVDTQLSCESSALNSPAYSEEKSQKIDSELAELLISSEKGCLQEVAGASGATAVFDDRSNEAEDDSIVHFAGLDVEMGKGKALIHILSNEGNHLLLERALKACKGPIDLEIEDLNGQTALNIAARNGHLEIVNLLLQYSIPSATTQTTLVDVNHADRDGWTPLRSASWGGHTEVVKILIGHPKCSIDRSDKEGRTALRAAAWSGNEDIVKILIAAGADVNSIDKQGRTSLIAASYMGHYDIVEILLQNGADVNHTDLDGRNALCVAALCGSSGYNKVIACLLEHGANTDQTDNEGMSPLLVSSFEGNGEICELLLENAADPDLADQMGRTPLWAASTSGHANVVKLLLFWGCGIDCMDSEGRTVLSVASAQGNLETVRQLLDRGLDETHRDNAGWTPLHYAAFEGYADICVQLLESGAKIDECDNEGKAALHLAAQEGHNAVIQVLLEVHSACIDQQAHDGKTAFRLACLEGHLECIQSLLKYGGDVNLKDADSRTTLYILALENKLKMVKFLLEYSNVSANIPDSEGRTALHVSSWQGHVDMVKLLITAGNADVNAMDADMRTPLHSCAWQGNHEVMQLLLFYGAMPDHACKQGATALGISAQEGHEECVTILLQFGANPLKSDHCGRTPIKLAAKSNRNNVLKILESYSKNEHHASLQPEKHHEKTVLQPSPNTPHNPNLLMANNIHHAGGSGGHLNATSSTQNSNFYENTMHSDTSSAHKRKSVISSQSTGSSNEAPISFTQQLQKHSRHHNSKNSHVVQSSSASGGSKYVSNSKKHAQVLPNVEEYHQTNLSNLASNIRMHDADLFDCLSPLYATPPHSPSSDLSSPRDDIPSNSIVVNHDHHFARDTHMRIILGNNMREQKEKEQGKSKRSGIATNPAMRLIRNRIDSAAQLLRRTNNYITNSGNGQGSSSIGVKSGTFQWSSRKESQM